MRLYWLHYFLSYWFWISIFKWYLFFPVHGQPTRWQVVFLHQGCSCTPASPVTLAAIVTRCAWQPPGTLRSFTLPRVLLSRMPFRNFYFHQKHSNCGIKKRPEMKPLPLYITLVAFANYSLTSFLSETLHFSSSWLWLSNTHSAQPPVVTKLHYKGLLLCGIQVIRTTQTIRNRSRA